LKKHFLNSASDIQPSAKKALRIRARSKALKCYWRAFGSFLVISSLSVIPVFVQSEDRIPTGFKLERYAQVWERNPFTLVTPSVLKSQPSAFEKLFLASWLREGGKDVIIVQNLDTNATQRITAEPNQNSLYLIEMRLNANPQLTEAIISDGKERGGVKFRFESVAAQAIPGSSRAQNSGANGEATSPITPPEPTALPNVKSKSFPAAAPQNHATVHRFYPGIPRVHTEGLPDPTPSTQKASWRHASPNSAGDPQSNPDQN
jgi:hypothetical protein